jgi:hypothetical protein
MMAEAAVFEDKSPNWMSINRMVKASPSYIQGRRFKISRR